MKILSDKKMKTLNENHLFEALNLTKPTDEDYNEFLEASLNRFISSQPYLQKPMASEHSSIQEDESGTKQYPEEPQIVIKRFNPTIVRGKSMQ